MKNRFSLLMAALAALLSLPACGNEPQASGPTTHPQVGDSVAAPSFDDRISLPEGFHIWLFAEVPNARSLAVSPETGTVYVGNRAGDKVYALPDGNGDHVADKVIVVDEGLDTPNGVAWHEGDLYVAEVSRILRYRDIDRRMADSPEFEVVTDQLPEERHHGWKYIAFGPDGWLYVPVGAPCNVCYRPDDPRFSSITRMRPDGSGAEVFAHGVRNTVGFDWHPETKELWFTDNGRDWMGDDSPCDELNHAPRAGMHFGFPHCHCGKLADPEYAEGRPCSGFEPPTQELGAHVAALGMSFYRGDMFPEAYGKGVFIAEHGSWNRSSKVGYRVSFVELDEAGNAGSYQPFATGWLADGEAWGRPVDVLPLADGSILVSDDLGGKVYRITYEAP